MEKQTEYSCLMLNRDIKKKLCHEKGIEQYPLVSSPLAHLVLGS